jgi:isoamylase
VDARGNRIVDDTLLILLNAHHEPLSFVLPAHRRNVRWELVLDTRGATPKQRRRLVRGGRPYEMEARSLALFRLQREETPDEAGVIVRLEQGEFHSVLRE